MDEEIRIAMHFFALHFMSFLVTGGDWEEGSEIGNLHTGGVSYLAHTHFYLSHYPDNREQCTSVEG